MINNQNSHLYLKCLVKIAEDHPLCFEEIPKEFIDYFSLPGISQCINISNYNLPKIDMDKVENYIRNNSFSDFEEIASSIRDNFDTIYEKLYASFYFVTQHVEYDEERKLMIKKVPLSIQTIFNKKKGVCADYAKLFRELAKRAGITSKMIRILPFGNASKGDGWDSFIPPSDPKIDHECNYIEIDNQHYLSEPTWGSGKPDNNHRPYFLIPYHKGILDHFPENLLNESLNCHFTWEQFTSHNIPDLESELCFESNPFQKITVENGFYDLQFSFIQPVNSISGSIHIRKENNWCKIKKKYLSFNCLGENLPKHSFSYSNQLRCRYNLTITFPEKGEYKVCAYVNGYGIFTVYFDVKSATDKLMGIYGENKEKFGFIPIVPKKGLSEINNGFARIRFAVKLSRSPLLIQIYSIKKGTLKHINKKEEQLKHSHSYYTINFPFNCNNDDLNDYLVEDWIIVNFPYDGRWEVKIYFKDEGINYTYGVSYYFDVLGTKDNNNNIFPFYDLPNDRTFIPFKTKIPDKVWIEPSTKTVIKEDDNFDIHVFSEFEVLLNFKKFGTDKVIHPVLISETETGNGNIKDWLYSPHLENGQYVLNLFDNNNQFINSQDYFITDHKLKKESNAEKKLMAELKNLIDGKPNLLKDVPLSIQKTVEKMVEESINEAKSNNSNDNENNAKPADFFCFVDENPEEEDDEEEKAKLKNKIKDLEALTSNLEAELNKITSKLKEQENHSNLLEQEKNDLSNKFKELMKQRENLNSASTENDEEKNELVLKLKQQNDDLNNKFKEIEKQKEELEKPILILEQEKNELNNKINEFEQRKQEFENKIKNLEKQNDDLNNKFKEIEKQKEELEKPFLILEQEKNELIRKVNELQKQKEEQEELMHLHEQEKNKLDIKMKGLMTQMENINNFSIENDKEKKELELKLNDLEKQNNDLNNKFKEIKSNKEEQEKLTRLLEQEKNDLYNKINELEKQKEEIIKNNEKQKLDVESKVSSFQNKIQELEEIQKNELDEIKKLEQEKNEINKKLNKLALEDAEKNSNIEKDKNKMIDKLKELENRTSALEEEKNSMNDKIKELTKQKEDQENYVHSLELQNEEINKKLEKLINQDDDITQKVDDDFKVKNSIIIQNMNNIHSEESSQYNDDTESDHEIQDVKNGENNEKEKNIGIICDIGNKDKKSTVDYSGIQSEDEETIGNNSSTQNEDVKRAAKNEEDKNKEIKGKFNEPSIKHTLGQEIIEDPANNNTVDDDGVFMQLEISEDEEETAFSDENSKPMKVRPPNHPNNSPRSKKNCISTYDPSIFYASIKEERKPQKAIHNLVKTPIELKTTLADIGLEGLDSPIPDKTYQLKKEKKENKTKQKPKVYKNKKQTNSHKSQNKELMRPTSLKRINHIKNNEINHNNFNQNSFLDDSSDDSFEIYNFSLNEIEEDFSPQKQKDEIKNQKNRKNENESFTLNLNENQAASRSPRKKKGPSFEDGPRVFSFDSCLPELRKH